MFFKLYIILYLKGKIMKRILSFIVIYIVFITNVMALSFRSNLDDWEKANFSNKKQFLTKQGKDVTKCVKNIDEYIKNSKKTMAWNNEKNLFIQVVSKKCINSESKKKSVKQEIEHIFKEINKSCEIKAIWIEPIIKEDTKKVILCSENKKVRIYTYYNDTNEVSNFFKKVTLINNKYYIDSGEFYTINLKTVVINGSNGWKETYHRIK